MGLKDNRRSVTLPRGSPRLKSGVRINPAKAVCEFYTAVSWLNQARLVITAHVIKDRNESTYQLIN